MNIKKALLNIVAAILVLPILAIALTLLVAILMVVVTVLAITSWVYMACYCAAMVYESATESKF